MRRVDPAPSQNLEIYETALAALLSPVGLGKLSRPDGGAGAEAAAKPSDAPKKKRRWGVTEYLFGKSAADDADGRLRKHHVPLIRNAFRVQLHKARPMPRCTARARAMCVCVAHSSAGPASRARDGPARWPKRRRRTASLTRP